MKKYKITALLMSCVLLAAGAVGCDSVSTSEVNLDFSSTEGTEPATAASEFASDSNNAGNVTTMADKSALDSAVGFTTYSIDDSAYVPTSYSLIGKDVAEITYNHDGNTATLRMTKTPSQNLSGVSGTENADSLVLSEYGSLTIDIGDNNGGYVAEWTAMDKDDDQLYFSLVENNVDINVFENTIMNYAKTAFSTDQSALADYSVSGGENPSDESESAEGETQSELIGTCDNNLESYSFTVKTAGTYRFTDPISDNDTWWDIYVLDEPSDEGDRYIMSNEESKGQTPVTLKLKKGQAVYCFCNKNQWNVDEQVDCKLTIERLY